jgi:hypothetical protein
MVRVSDVLFTFGANRILFCMTKDEHRAGGGRLL